MLHSGIVNNSPDSPFAGLAEARRVRASRRLRSITKVTPSVTTTGAVVAAPPAAPVAPAAESEVVCRMVKVTGTRLRKERVCTSNVTREQSAEWLRNQQDHGNNIGSNALVNGGG